jgi:hypothetical protein
MAKKKATGLPASPAPLITSPAILVRHLICPQLGGPTVSVCLTSSKTFDSWAQLQGRGEQDSAPAVAGGRNGARPG